MIVMSAVAHEGSPAVDINAIAGNFMRAVRKTSVFTRPIGPKLVSSSSLPVFQSSSLPVFQSSSLPVFQSSSLPVSKNFPAYAQTLGNDPRPRTSIDQANREFDRRCAYSHNHATGFTLIELMVTIAVVAILLSLAIPSFKNQIVSSRLNSVSSEIVDAVSFARSEAIKRNGAITLCRAATAEATSCTSGTEWQHWIVLAGSDVVRQGAINSYSASIKVSSDLTNDRIDFSGDGLARTGGNLLDDAQVTVCATSGPADSIRTVTLGAASRISTKRVGGVCS